MANQVYRLSEARELRGFTIMELADKLGVSRQTIYKYESGTQNPSAEIMQKIVEVLDLPYSFFAKPYVGLQFDDRPIFFRDMKTNLDKNRKMAKRWLHLLYDRVMEYENYLLLPKVNIPVFEISDFSELELEEIDNIAEKVRRFWGLGDGPISNLTLLLENNGFIIAHKDVLSDKLDACSMIFNGRPCILVNTKRFTCSRVLMNLAHELGHIILHQGAGMSDIADASTLKLIEAQAKRFAASFLMPPSTFSNEVGYPTISQFILLKRRWRTSIASMALHCRSLGLINEEKKQYFLRELSRNGMLKFEPLDDELDVESTNLLFDCERAIVEAGLELQDALLQKSCLTQNDYCELISAPVDYFEPIRKKPILRLINS